jgi:thiamine-monophosphate kinase
MARRKTLSDLTEAGFHRRLIDLLPSSNTDQLPLGDDCAALPWMGRRVLLLTTDAVAEGTHFPSDAPPRLVGRFAANVNLSDIAAKGGLPLGLLLDLLLPPKTEARWAEEVVIGLEEAARSARVHLVGGDTKRAKVRAVVAMALGEGVAGHLMPRGGGHDGDLIATTGTVGRGGSAYLAWKHDLVGGERSLQRLLTVGPRLKEGTVLRDFATAALDTSDGLALSVRLLTEASGLSAIVDEGKLPLDPEVPKVASKLGRSPTEVAFIGGDYELLVAIPPRRAKAAKEAVGRVGGRLTFIGELTERKGAHRSNILMSGKKVLPLPDIGWDAFAPQL